MGAFVGANVVGALVGALVGANVGDCEIVGAAVGVALTSIIPQYTACKANKNLSSIMMVMSKHFVL